MATRIKKNKVDKRDIAQYYVDHNSTMRQTGAHFGVSKSYVYESLVQIQEDPDTKGTLLAIQVKELIDKNTVERAVRGGTTTGEKMRKKKQKIV